jgi:alkanesulfonate monooxygenase SsuD/methylene tetrahydromethanopterin reductase-like flavin-dependent oxidoreductase (luciferase family)
MSAAHTTRNPVKIGVIPAHGVDHLDHALEQIRLCREYGFDSVWIEEHHADGPYWPTPLLAIAALAPHLGGLEIGTDILVLPLHDPVHIAEQTAVLDRMTNGRFILGVGLGDSAPEFAAFRVPADRRGTRFEEQLAIIRALWTGQPLTHHGRYYTLENVQLETLPKQDGGPPIWIGGWGPRQLRRAALIGDAWLAGPVGTLPELTQRQASYEQLIRNDGRDPSTRPRPVTRDVIIADTDDQAWKLAIDQVLPRYADIYLESDHLLVGRKTTTAHSTLRELAQNRLIIGQPSTVSNTLRNCITRLRWTHLILRLKLPGLTPPEMTTMLRLLGEEVLPELRTQEVPATEERAQ